MNAHQLIGSYHDECLIPNQQEVDSMRNQAHRIFNAYKNSSSLGPMECRIAGSLEKGTMLSERMEADIELFYPNRSYRFENVREEVSRIAFDCFPQAEIESSKKGITIHLERNGKWRSFDVVFGYPVNSPLQMAEVRNEYEHIVTTGLFHVDYAKAQKNVRDYYPKIVRLIKEWRDAWELPLKSIQIELIVASSLEFQRYDPIDYPECLKACFREIQGMCDGNLIEPVNWPIGEEAITAQSNEAGICIVDPADPSTNIGNGLDVEAVDILRSHASRGVTLVNQEDWNELWQEKYFD